MKHSENEQTGERPGEPLQETDYDHLQRKPKPANDFSEAKPLPERLEDYKRDPTGKPWETAFKKLVNPNDEGVC